MVHYIIIRLRIIVTIAIIHANNMRNLPSCNIDDDNEQKYTEGNKIINEKT